MEKEILELLISYIHTCNIDSVKVNVKDDCIMISINNGTYITTYTFGSARNFVGFLYEKIKDDE